MTSHPTYSINLDGDVFTMSSRKAAVAACEANATGGILISLDGTRLRVEPKTQTVIRYQSLGNFDDGGVS